MRRIQRVILQETRGPVVISLVVLTFVVFTREFGRLAELLIRRNAELTTVAKAVAYLMPSILIFTLPFSFLIGTLIGLSRLQSDSEIVAMRAGGVSVYQMLTPVLKIGFLVLMATGALTLFLLPGGNWKLRSLRHEIGLSPVYAPIKPRVFFEEFPGVLLYVEDIDLRSAAWKGIFLSDSSDAGETRIILAERGGVLATEDGRRLQLHFENGQAYSFPSASPERTTISSFGTLDLPIEIQTADIVETREKRPRDKSMAELWKDIRLSIPNDRWTALVEVNRRIALPISAMIFAVLAVTLGIRTPRGGRGYGFVVSMTVAFTYYILFATGSTLSKNGVLPILVGVWGANICTAILALLALRLSDRESLLIHRISNSRIFVAANRHASRTVRYFLQWLSRTGGGLRRRMGQLPGIRLRVARVVDLYMIRIFFRNLLATLVTCLALVYLFTLFEIIDDVFENRIPYSLILDYFFFLQPHFLMLLVPISVLIATLITFGSLEKTNQIIAFKSCGISLYRIALPVLALATTVSGCSFLIQEYILPYANQRQDNLRNIIKGSPIQTSQPGRKWIFGEDGRLYHYNLFSSERDVFVELSIYQLDLGEITLLNSTYATRGSWDRISQRWQLQQGWTRDFEQDSFEVFETRSFQVPESPDFFDAEVRDSSKMTYPELRKYIETLQLGGFEVGYLKTELYKKLSFPVVNLVMALLGLPFALTMGKKGALYGVAAGVLLGIAYWGAFGVFDVLGSNGLLAPVLAAWGPNIVFGSVAFLFLSTTRT